MFPASFIQSEFKFNTVYGGDLEKVTPPQNYLEGIEVRQEVCLYSSEGVHWVELQSDGSLLHSLYRGVEQVKQHLWRFSSPVKQFSAILLHGHLHMLMAYEPGVYYARCSVTARTDEKQEFRISRHPSSSNPYLFNLGRTLYFGFTTILNQKFTYVLRQVEQGRWRERSFSYIREDYGANVHIEQASCDISESGTLYGLFLIRNGDTNRQQLMLLELDMESEEAKWQPVFSSAQAGQSWSITVSAAREGDPYLAWVVHNGITATVYCTRGRQDTNSCIPLKVFFQNQFFAPRLTIAGEHGLFLSITGSSWLACAYSSNGGKDWGTFMEVPFARESRLRIIQGVRSSEHDHVPVSLLGTGYPYFRPIELIDLFHPFLTMNTRGPSIQDDVLLHYAKLQLGVLHEFASGRIAAWQEEMMLLEERLLQEEHALQRLETYIEEMEREQVRVLEQLHAVGSNLAPFGIRLIQ